ncbi:pro-sigmaK processing inhibitor BofA family protein [Methanobacterium alcaliphilum]|uniref:pro-sigmaK processing inhibitor BofA family protein n=1 Tax=Methanobacterium alcaliphilum TaxID=392018 RepID=UPI00200A42A2|nr:pro-sigmaK processing inhibitor BofA family protein [Methanobacterium alcaliphilum]MCK9151434.1 pro-sigmaK processing inhibitor BofA family protein [Methanobacterium alcaliphilum]
MEIFTVMILIVIGSLIVALGLFGIKLLSKIGKFALTSVFNMVMGVIFLFIVNLVPFIEIPINILTVLVAGFGGIMGVGILVIGQAMGLF